MALHNELLTQSEEIECWIRHWQLRLDLNERELDSITSRRIRFSDEESDDGISERVMLVREAKDQLLHYREKWIELKINRTNVEKEIRKLTRLRDAANAS